MLLPHLGRLAQLVAQLRPLLILGLPPHHPRPVGEERFVDDLDPVLAGLFAFGRGHLERGQESGVDELVEDLGGDGPVTAGILVWSWSRC